MSVHIWSVRASYLYPNTSNDPLNTKMVLRLMLVLLLIMCDFVNMIFMVNGNVFRRIGLDSFFFDSPVTVRSGRGCVCGSVPLALKREALKILSIVCFDDP